MTHRLTILALLAAVLLPFSAFAQESKNLTTEQKEAFNAMVLEKTQSLGNYLSIIGNEEVGPEKKEMTVNQAVKLFVNDRQVVQISSKNRPDIIKKTITQYLNHLRNLPYAKVEIKWSDVVFINELKKGVDGRYSATVSVKQKFVGYDGEGNVIYSDETIKAITVYLEEKEVRFADRTVMELGLLLSDIGVTQTSDN